MASTRTGVYRIMCDAVERLGGTVRLGRQTDSWGLTVTVQLGEVDCAPRAAGFFFNDLKELDAHARIILDWLAARRSSNDRRRDIA